MNEIYFKWNDIMYKRSIIDGEVHWFDVEYSNNRMNRHREMIMEEIYRKYPNCVVVQ